MMINGESVDNGSYQFKTTSKGDKRWLNGEVKKIQ